jgi:hypothetical protein
VVVLRRKWCGETAWQWREILAPNEVGLDVIAILSQVSQQATEVEEVMEIGLIAELLLLTQPAEPPEQMRIAAQLRQATKPRESGV